MAISLYDYNFYMDELYNTFDTIEDEIIKMNVNNNGVLNTFMSNVITKEFYDGIHKLIILYSMTDKNDNYVLLKLNTTATVYDSYEGDTYKKRIQFSKSIINPLYMKTPFVTYVLRYANKTIKIGDNNLDKKQWNFIKSVDLLILDPCYSLCNKTIDRDTYGLLVNEKYKG